MSASPVSLGCPVGFGPGKANGAGGSEYERYMQRSSASTTTS
jgi:hypothetical protein